MAAKVDIAGTSISAPQMSEFFRLAAVPESFVNSVTFQAYLEHRNPFPQPEEPREKVIPAKPVKPLLDAIIRVNRSVRPAYQDWADLDWINSPEFIALEQAGPAEYALATRVEQWLHEGQKNGGWVSGQVIRDFLIANDELANHLALADGLAIQQKGVAVFRKFFAGKAVFLWRSAVRGRAGNWYVPYLYGDGSEVYLYWRWLDHKWNGGYPALRFAK